MTLLLYSLLIFLLSKGFCKFIALEEKLYSQFSRDNLSATTGENYYYYDSNIFGNLFNINYTFGFWFLYTKTQSEQFLFGTDYFNFSMTNTNQYLRNSQVYFTLGISQFDKSNWMYISFEYINNSSYVVLSDPTQIITYSFSLSPMNITYFSLFQNSLYQGWQGLAVGINIKTGIKKESYLFEDVVNFNILQPQTLLFLKFQEKVQPKLLKDWSINEYEVMLGGSYRQLPDFDDPVLDTSDQSFIFGTNKFLNVSNFYLPNSFTLEFTFSLSDSLVQPFKLLSLYQRGSEKLYIQFSGTGLNLWINNYATNLELNMGYEIFMISVQFQHNYNTAGDDLNCIITQRNNSNWNIVENIAGFPYFDLSDKYGQYLLIGNQDNQFTDNNMYFKLFEFKISQGVYFMELYYQPYCLFYNIDRCIICDTPYVLSDSGTCIENCPDGFIFNTQHNKCIRICHQLCETCEESNPSVCITCSGNRQNPPECKCTMGFEDETSDCKEYMKDISIQTGIIEGTCIPQKTSYIQNFSIPYKQIPHVILSIYGMYESQAQTEFQVYNNLVELDSFQLAIICQQSTFYSVKWVSGISDNFINSIQNHQSNILSYSFEIPYTNEDQELPTLLGWQVDSAIQSYYYIDQNYITNQASLNLFILVKYQIFQFWNYPVDMYQSSFNSNDRKILNNYGTSGTSCVLLSYPLYIDSIVFIKQFIGEQGLKFQNLFQYTSQNTIKITKLTQGNQYFGNFEFFAVALGTICNNEGPCDYFEEMINQCKPDTLSCECQPGYYYDGSICSQCDSNCYECSDNASTCVSCLASQLKQLDSSTCICIDGYVLDETNICQRCDSNCLTCKNSPTECTGCDSAQHLTLSFAGSSCQCIDRMEFDENQICICSSGYYDSAGECLGCMSLCQDCNDGSTCNSCVNNSTYQNLEQICQCNTGYYSSNNECLQCNSNCQECETTSTNCISCNSNLIVVSGVCQCDTNQYLDDSNVCQLCNASCLTCQSSPNNCTTCDSNSTIQYSQNNMEIVIGYCVCHSGYYLPVNAACQSCDPNCVECQDEPTKCTQCLGNDHQLLNEITNKCECEVGYYMVDNGCLKCDSLCHECVGEANFCTSCPSEFKQIAIEGQCQCLKLQYVDSSNICQDCDSNCLTCETEPNNCLSCYPYFYILNSECVECHKTCSSCSGPQETECTACITNMTKNEESLCVCKEGYFEEEPLKCSECKKTCKSCENVNECKECLAGLNRKLDNSNQCSCEKGFYEVNQEQKCQRCMKTCVTCNNGTSCTSCDPETRELLKGVCQCKDGYFQNGLGECISCESVEAQSVESCNYKNCSDKVWTKGEECDDGNNVARDGCTNCQIDPNYKCVNELLKPSFCYTCPENCNSCELEGNLIICQECEDGYFLYESQCKQCSGSCQTCESLTFCKTCQVQSFIPNEVGKCPVCEDTPGLYTQGSQCVPKCGDGILYEATEACDDGNTTSGDGCDSSCQKEKNFNCTGGVCEKVEPPKVEATYTNATTKNDILLSLPKNQKDPCANIIITIEAFNDTEFQSNFKYDNTSETQQCNIDFTFLKTIDESNLIHLFVPIVDDEDNSTNSTRRRLQEAETREVVITPRKQIYYSESQKAQAKTAQSAQDTFGTSLYIIGPATIMLGGFNFFWTIMDILSWLNNLYYFNIFFPDNVGVLFQQAAWGDFEIIPPIVEFNQESDPYYTESPLKFMEKGVDPVFLNNTWMCFTVIGITFLTYIVSIFVYSCFICYQKTMQGSKKRKVQAISLFKINSITHQKINKEIEQKYEFKGFLKKVYVKVLDYKVNILGYLIKSLNLGILDLILAITMQIIYFDISEVSYQDILINYIICYFSIILVIVVLGFQYQMTKRHYLLLGDARYEAKFGTLYEGINIKSKLAMSYSFFNLIRKALYIIVLIVFYENPIFQTLCCCLISFINVGLILYENPFISKGILIQNGIPDFCIFILTLISTGIAMDDRIGYLDADQRFTVGWVMISFIGLSILTQVVFMFKEFGESVYKNFTYLYNKLRQMKSGDQKI